MRSDAARLARFAVVGAIGFVVDAGVLHGLLAGLSLNPYLARVPSFLSAATVTWLLNRHWTFADRRGSARATEWGRYLLTMLGGGAVNYAVYAGLLATLPLVARWPVLGVAAGSLAGMMVNYLGADRWIFRLR
ncbi:GtrA family protein [Fontimonas sp. SYSU GA230001]|uniref:GtrA family protein n=1 Tax=Fontimonas sp. SYSU GA230001 TaxID=3142450 RepID=UPI0032B53806